MTTTTTDTTDADDKADTITLTVMINGTELVRQFQATKWRRNDDGRLYVYDGDTTVAEIESEHVVEIVREQYVSPGVLVPTEVLEDADAELDDIIRELERSITAATQ